MNHYEYFILGIILGLAIAVYFYESKKEKISKNIAINSKLLSTAKLENVLEKSFERIKNSIQMKEENLTEEEKNEIIKDCFSKEFN